MGVDEQWRVLTAALTFGLGFLALGGSVPALGYIVFDMVRRVRRT